MEKLEGQKKLKQRELELQLEKLAAEAARADEKRKAVIRDFKLAEAKKRQALADLLSERSAEETRKRKREDGEAAELARATDNDGADFATEQGSDDDADFDKDVDPDNDEMYDADGTLEVARRVVRANLKLHAISVKSLQGKLWHKDMKEYGDATFETVDEIPFLATNAATHLERCGAISAVLLDWKNQHVAAQKKAAKRFVQKKRDWERNAAKRGKGRRKARDSVDDISLPTQSPRANGYVRSEAEFQSIMSMLQGGDKHATPPPMVTLQPASHRLPVYLDSNGLVNQHGRDCTTELAERKKINPWTSQEKTVFMDRFAQFERHADRFFKIEEGLKKAGLPQKKYGDIVQLYYKNKKKTEFRKEIKRKAPSKKQAAALLRQKESASQSAQKPITLQAKNKGQNSNAKGGKSGAAAKAEKEAAARGATNPPSEKSSSNKATASVKGEPQSAVKTEPKDSPKPSQQKQEQSSPSSSQLEGQTEAQKQETETVHAEADQTADPGPMDPASGEIPAETPARRNRAYWTVGDEALFTAYFRKYCETHPASKCQNPDDVSDLLSELHSKSETQVRNLWLKYYDRLVTNYPLGQDADGLQPFSSVSLEGLLNEIKQEKLRK
eukprot:SAG31_NODE_347_length_17310_cov_3.764743_14_plen_614_part_01